MSLVQGGQTLILIKGRGVFWIILIVFRGNGIANRGVQGDSSPLLGDFPSINQCLNLCPGGIKLHSIKYPGGGGGAPNYVLGKQ